MSNFVKSIILSTAVIHVCVESITKVGKHTKTYFKVWPVPDPFNTIALDAQVYNHVLTMSISFILFCIICLVLV